MERCARDVRMADEDRLSAKSSKNLDGRTYVKDARRANEDERLPSVRCGFKAFELTSPRVARDADIDESEASLFRLRDPPCHENQPSTRGEYRTPRANERREWSFEIELPKEFELNGAFASGKDESIKGVEVSLGSNENWPLS